MEFLYNRWIIQKLRKKDYKGSIVKLCKYMWTEYLLSQILELKCNLSVNYELKH